jgi:phosphatidylglycerol:prolipoprotein diacylglycerol transferase
LPAWFSFHSSGTLSEDFVHSTFFQLGPLHLSSLGVCAAIGVMAALALSQKTAWYAGLDPDAVWNAGMAAVVSAFVISRGLLIAFNWHSFLEYPVLVMALPSLTSTGVLLTGLFMLAYLRWRRLPLIPFLDAIAPCAALLWWLLVIGEYLAGERDGMPVEPGSFAGRLFGSAIQPVELYTLALAGALCVLLLAVMLTRPLCGVTGGVALALAGAGVFFIDFFRLPSQLLPDSWLDPVQALGIVMAVLGSLLLYRAIRRSERTVRWSEKRNETTDAV